ncbi:Ras- protein Rab-2A [Chytriomyces hyalinus]|nr:Ras- protein Rab-2A [Chytriomyces hyalinus]
MKRSSTTSASNPKKVKFDQGANSFDGGPVDDDEDLEFGKKKRNAIKLGYTDSDDEDDGGFDSDQDSNDGDKDKDKDKADDMFATEEEATAKGIKFISKDTLHEKVGAEHDGEEDIAAGGVAIEPFNMNNEMEEGGFDENFNYIRTLDEHAFHDKWLGGISGDEIKRAKVASDRQKARISAMDAMEEEDADENSCWKTVLSFMKPKETVAGALKRLGGPKKIPAWKKNQKKKLDSSTAETEETPEAAELRKKSLADLITVTDSLTGQYGRYDVMEQTYESLARILRIANLLDDNWQPGDPVGSTKKSSESKVMWEYKLSAESDDVLGPFPASQMLSWKESGFWENIESIQVRLRRQVVSPAAIYKQPVLCVHFHYEDCIIQHPHFNHPPVPTETTIGIEFGSQIISVKERRVKLQIWDTAGQESFRSISRAYYRGAIGCLLVYDMTRRESFQHLVTWLEDVKQHGNEEIITILIANKADLADQRQVSREEGEAFAAEHGLLYTEASAKSGENVANSFLAVAASVYETLNLDGRDVASFKDEEVRRLEAHGVKFGPRRIVGVNGSSPVRIQASSNGGNSASGSNGGCC